MNNRNEGEKISSLTSRIWPLVTLCNWVMRSVINLIYIYIYIYMCVCVCGCVCVCVCVCVYVCVRVCVWYSVHNSREQCVKDYLLKATRWVVSFSPNATPQDKSSNYSPRFSKCVPVCVCVREPARLSACVFAYVYLRMSVKFLYLDLILKFRDLRDTIPYPCIDSYWHPGGNIFLNIPAINSAVILWRWK
jgi:hypothetical protein